MYEKGLVLMAAVALGSGVLRAAPVVRHVDDYGAVGDGITDDSYAIQSCLNDGYNGKWSMAAQVIFTPGKTYRVAHQLVVWAGIHLVSDPDDPATILLAANTPGFDNPNRPHSMILSRLSAFRQDHAHLYAEDIYRTYLVGPRKPVPGWPWKWPEEYDSAERDESKIMPTLGAGNNFWSQIRNLNFRTEPGNPGAIVLNWLNAQGSLLSNLDIDMADDTLYGIWGGSVVANCRIRGGRFGLFDASETQCGSILGTLFIGQKEAGILGERFASRMILRTTFKNVPVGIVAVQPRSWVMVNCVFSNLGRGMSVEKADSQMLFQNIRIENTPLFFQSPEQFLPGRAEGTITLPTFVNGPLVKDGDIHRFGGVMQTTTELPDRLNIPEGFDVSRAANIRDFGAVGDGVADDTDPLRQAIAASDVVYLPSGKYRLTDTVLLRRNTKLIGEHVASVRIVMHAGQEGFTDPDHPRPVLDTPDDPQGEIHIRQLMMNSHPRGDLGGLHGAIGLRWRVGRRSSVAMCGLNLGANPILVTGNGGGSFFGIWTASSGLTRGMVIRENQEPLIAFGFSSEHQTDKAIQLIGARDVTLYKTQNGEGGYPHERVPGEIIDSDRIAWIFVPSNPMGNDAHRSGMTLLKIENTENVWVGPDWRVHQQPVKSSLRDTRPDGSVVDLENLPYALYRQGEINTRNLARLEADPLAWSAVTPREVLAAQLPDEDSLQPYVAGTSLPDANVGGGPWSLLATDRDCFPIPAGDGPVALHVNLMNPKSQALRFEIESPSSARLLLDGRPVAMKGEGRRFTAEAPVAKGWRSLFVLPADEGRGGDLRISITTTNGEPSGVVFSALPPAVSPLLLESADAFGREIRLIWRRSEDFGGGKVRIVRKADGYPTNIEDGEIVFEGMGEQSEYPLKGVEVPVAVHQDRVPDGVRAMHYALYALRSDGAVSRPALRRVDLGAAPYIEQWLACGPFVEETPDRQHIGFGVDVIGEADARPEAGDVSGGQPWHVVPWHRARTGFIDLNDEFRQPGDPEYLRYQFGYLFTYIHAEEATDGMLLLGVDDGFEIYLNGARIAADDRAGIHNRDQFAFPVRLEKGENRLLIKITQTILNWAATVRIAQDRQGTLIPVALTYSTASDKN